MPIRFEDDNGREVKWSKVETTGCSCLVALAFIVLAAWGFIDAISSVMRVLS